MIYTTMLNGEAIGYTDDTIFLVEVGKAKGSYKTIAEFKGSLRYAVSFYKGLNLGATQKKRLTMKTSVGSSVLMRKLPR